MGLIHGQTRTFLFHLLALVIVSAFTFLGSLLLYKVVGLLVPLRVTEEQEHEGLDRSQHAETVGESALAALHSSAPASAS